MELGKPNPVAEQAKHKEEFTNAVKALPLDLRFKAVALETIYAEKRKLDEELEQKIRELQLQYERKAEPIYLQSSEIITGKRLPQENELKDLNSYFTNEEIEKKNEYIKEGPIPEFWLKVLQNSPVIKEEIHGKDEEILRKLTNIEIRREEDSLNYTIVFHFDENEYFTNKELTKRVICRKDDGEPEKFEGSTIEWKEGKNITKKKITKKQKNKKTGQQRVTTKEVDAESLFNFFKDSAPSTEDADDSDAEAADERFNVDCDIAQFLSEEIVPYALDFYLGIVQDEEDPYGDEEDYDDEDEDDEEEEPKPKGKGKPKAKKSQDDDDDDEEEEGAKKGKKKGQTTGGDKPQNQECKQQ